VYNTIIIMSLYQRYAQGDAKKNGTFKLTKDNIGFYRDQSDKMDEELRRLKSYIEIKDKLDNPEKQDYLYTPDYLNRRMTKLQTQLVIDEKSKLYMNIKSELDGVNAEIKIVFPQVMDKETGKNPEIHEKMSDLNDKRKELEDDMVNAFADKYRDLHDNLSKIFFMILEGVDMETVQRCFRNMTAILSEQMSVDEGAEDMMSFSETKYNLPSTMYDPIRGKNPKGKKGKKGRK